MNFRYCLWAESDSCLKSDLRSPGNFDFKMFKKKAWDFDSVSGEARVCRLCLRDQIFRVLLEHFISEVVRK